jgi:hypothetical protein
VKDRSKPDPAHIQIGCNTVFFKQFFREDVEMKRILLMATVVLLAGCGVRAKSTLNEGAAFYVPHNGDVCLLAGAPPADVRYEVLGRVVATKRTYGSSNELFPVMANEARQLGGNAIINLQAGQKFKSPLPWRVTAPTGDGMAIKVVPDASALDCLAAGGNLVEGSNKTPSVAQAPAAKNSDDLYTDLVRLNDLRERGILTEEEFETEKKELLSAN